MSNASEYIKKLDKALNNFATFGDNKYQSFQELLASTSDDLNRLLTKATPEDWKEIYVDRDRAEIKRMILNRTMSLGQDNKEANPASPWREE